MISVPTSERISTQERNSQLLYMYVLSSLVPISGAPSLPIPSPVPHSIIHLESCLRVVWRKRLIGQAVNASKRLQSLAPSRSASTASTSTLSPTIPPTPNPQAQNQAQSRKSSLNTAITPLSPGDTDEEGEEGSGFVTAAEEDEGAEVRERDYGNARDRGHGVRNGDEGTISSIKMGEPPDQGQSSVTMTDSPGSTISGATEEGSPTSPAPSTGSGGKSGIRGLMGKMRL